MEIELLKRHEFIVCGEEHYNPLGVIRSLGEYGISYTIAHTLRSSGGIKPLK